MGIRALPEERDAPVDTGQLLEVARQPEVKEVGALLSHVLRQAAPPLRVVEHGSDTTER